MKLYLMINLFKGGRKGLGRVYHLTEACPVDTPDNDVIEVTPSMVKSYAKNLGIKRICLRCRKAFARKQFRNTGGSFRLQGTKIAIK